MVIKKINEVTYEEIIKILNNSGLIVYPTETCYGVGCNPLDQKAVDKLLQYKARREGKAVSIAVANKEMAESFVELNETAQNFYDRFLPGPFTVISKSKGVVANGIESEDKSLGIRIPDYAWFLRLLEKYNNAITSTSANQSYQKQPYKIEDILENASQKSLDLIDLIIDASELPHNPSSTVVNTISGDLHVLRKGQLIPEGAKANEFISHSESSTIQYGEELFNKFSRNLEFRPVIFALQGDMGAGKTHLTKGIVKAMGIDENIQSPTFILAKEYENKDGTKLVHVDTWRLETEDDLKALELEKLLVRNGKNNVVVIEWADKFLDYIRSLNLNMKIIWMELVYDPTDPNTRVIKWSE